MRPWSPITIGILALAVATGMASCSQPRLHPTPGPSVDANADPELGARFPATVAGAPFPIETFRDEETLRVAGINDRVLSSLGVGIGDISVAIGHLPMPTDESIHQSVFAFRVSGAGLRKLTHVFLPILEAQSEGIAFERATIDGKRVWRAPGRPVAVGGNMLYVRGDTAYLLYGDHRKVSEELLRALP